MNRRPEKFPLGYAVEDIDGWAKNCRYTLPILRVTLVRDARRRARERFARVGLVRARAATVAVGFPRISKIKKRANASLTDDLERCMKNILFVQI